MLLDNNHIDFKLFCTSYFTQLTLLGDKIKTTPEAASVESRATLMLILPDRYGGHLPLEPFTSNPKKKNLSLFRKHDSIELIATNDDWLTIVTRSRYRKKKWQIE